MSTGFALPVKRRECAFVEPHRCCGERFFSNLEHFHPSAVPPLGSNYFRGPGLELFAHFWLAEPPVTLLCGFIRLLVRRVYARSQKVTFLQDFAGYRPPGFGFCGFRQRPPVKSCSEDSGTAPNWYNWVVRKEKSGVNYLRTCWLHSSFFARVPSAAVLRTWERSRSATAAWPRRSRDPLWFSIMVTLLVGGETCSSSGPRTWPESRCHQQGGADAAVRDRLSEFDGARESGMRQQL